MNVGRAQVSNRVLGVDPGLSETGWAVVDAGSGRPSLKASGILRTPSRAPLPERLRQIHEGLAAVLRGHRPAALAVEEMFFLLAAHTVRASLQARGVVLLAAAQSGVPVAEYNPRQVKSALAGSGSAPKSQIQRMVARTLGLTEVLRPDDVSDAAAIALCHLRAGRGRGARVLKRIGAGPARVLQRVGVGAARVLERVGARDAPVLERVGARGAPVLERVGAGGGQRGR